MSEIKLPRIYLIKRSAVRDEAVQHALDINPVSVILATSAQDGEAAEALGAVNLITGAPIGVIAEFDHPLAAINEDGSVSIVVKGDKTMTDL